MPLKIVPLACRYDGVTFGTNGPDYLPMNGFTSASGTEWIPDAYYSGTSTHVTDFRDAVYSSTNDQILFQTERYGMSFYYDLNLPNGAYTVELWFAETRFNSTGSRVFSISINGQEVESNLDIFAKAGGQNIPYMTRYEGITVSNGLMEIFFNPSVYEAKVSGIHVYSNGAGNPLPSPPTSVSCSSY